MGPHDSELDPALGGEYFLDSHLDAKYSLQPWKRYVCRVLGHRWEWTFGLKARKRACRRCTETYVYTHIDIRRAEREYECFL